MLDYTDLLREGLHSHTQLLTTLSDSTVFERALRCHDNVTLSQRDNHNIPIAKVFSQVLRTDYFVTYKVYICLSRLEIAVNVYHLSV